MIFTARQLEDLLKANGRIVLPYGARLTPLAVDWSKHKKVVVGYGPDELVQQAARLPQPVGASAPASSKPGKFAWWCDGPCGAAKAAATAQAKESSLTAIDVPSDARELSRVIKTIAKSVKSNQLDGAVLMVHGAAAPVVLANRCPSLRAIVGTTLESLETGISTIAANVLIIEYARKSFSEIRNLMSRFVRANRVLSDDMADLIRGMTTCE